MLKKITMGLLCTSVFLSTDLVAMNELAVNTFGMIKKLPYKQAVSIPVPVKKKFICIFTPTDKGSLWLHFQGKKGSGRIGTEEMAGTKAIDVRLTDGRLSLETYEPSLVEVTNITPNVPVITGDCSPVL